MLAGLPAGRIMHCSAISEYLDLLCLGRARKIPLTKNKDIGMRLNMVLEWILVQQIYV